ncbi:flotillin family protein [Streptomyces tanashiensis]
MSPAAQEKPGGAALPVPPAQRSEGSVEIPVGDGE